MTEIKQFLKWVGVKSKLLPQLKPFFPEKFNQYFEPFIGGGGAIRECVIVMKLRS